MQNMYWVAIFSMLLALAGCGTGASKEESVCLDLVQRVVVDPGSIAINQSKTDVFDGDVSDVRKLFKERFSGEIPPASSNLLDLYGESEIPVKLIFAHLDVTFDGRIGKDRDQAMCSYVQYDGKTELRTFTWSNKDYSQDDLRMALLLDPPKSLDSNFRIK